MSDKAKKEFIKYAAEMFIDRELWYINKNVYEVLSAVVFDTWFWYVDNGMSTDLGFNEEELLKGLAEELGFLYIPNSEVDEEVEICSHSSFSYSTCDFTKYGLLGIPEDICPDDL